MAHIGRVGSVFVTVSVSLERYLGIRYPNNNHSIKKFFLPFPIAFAFLYNLPKFFEFAICYDKSIKLYETTSTFHIASDKTNVLPVQNMSNETNSFDPDHHPYPQFDPQKILDEIYKNQRNVSNTPTQEKHSIDCENREYGVTTLRKNQWYIIFYVFGSEVIFIDLLPWVIVIVLNLLTWKGIKKFQENRKRFIRSHSLGKIKTYFFEKIMWFSYSFNIFCIIAEY